jgi:hypothetical protein
VYCDRTEALDRASKPLLVTREGNYVCLSASLEEFFATTAARTEGLLSISGGAPKLTATLEGGKTASGSAEVIFASVFGKRGWKANPLMRGSPSFGGPL